MKPTIREEFLFSLKKQNSIPNLKSKKGGIL